MNPVAIIMTYTDYTYNHTKGACCLYVLMCITHNGFMFLKFLHSLHYLLTIYRLYIYIGFILTMNILMYCFISLLEIHHQQSWAGWS